MVLDIKRAKDIQDFVYAQPRTIQEVAHFLGKNWRTAESYVEDIIAQYGTLAMKTFRPGTKGALKIVYWAHIEKIHASTVQEELLTQIKTGRTKQEFEPFDLYQHVQGKKSVRSVGEKYKVLLNKHILETKKSLLNFSGNLSWTSGKKTCLSALEDAAKRGVSIKILTRVDIATMKNIQELLKINKKLGYEAIEIRHRFQPLRCFILDGTVALLKDEKDRTRYKGEELTEDMTLLYAVEDPLWVGWLEKVFWHFFSQATPLKERIAELEKVQEAIVASS
ncbi:MAG: hypothetical protein V1725_01360 [archaeon]